MAEEQNPTDPRPPGPEITEGEAVGGQELLPETVEENVIRRFSKTGPQYNLYIIDEAIANDRRFDLQPKRDVFVKLVGDLSDDKRRTKIAAVREEFEKDRIIRTDLLKEVVTESPDDAETKKIFNKIRQLVKSLPEK